MFQNIFCLYSSCFKVRCPVHLESSEEKHFYWEILFERSEVCKPRIKHFTLPVWAGTWKIMNFAFRQEKPEWDCVWPDYEEPISDKSEKTEELEEEVRTNVLLFIGLFVVLPFLLRQIHLYSSHRTNLQPGRPHGNCLGWNLTEKTL